MKSFILSLLFLVAFAGASFAQSPEPQAVSSWIKPPIYWETLFSNQALPVRVRTVNSAVNISSVSEMIFPNGSLTQFGSKVEIAAGAGGSNTALSNLTTTSINQSLLPQSGKDIGSAAAPWRDLYLYGGGTFGTTSFRFTGTPTAARTITLPDADITLSNGTTINASDGVIPYRSSATAFSDSPISRVSSTAIAVAGSQVNTSNAAACLSVGPNGDTNPVLRAVCSVASQADGVSVTGLAAGSGTTFTALSSGSNAGFTFLPKGTGVITATPAGSSSSTLTILHSDLTKVVQLGILSGTPSRGGLYLGNVTPNTTNYALAGDGAGNTNFNSTADIYLTISGSVSSRFTSRGLTVGSGTLGTSATNTIGIANGTAPTTSPADMSQIYNGDAAAGDANVYTRNEAGEINRLTGLASGNSAAFSKTSDAALTSITGIPRNVEANRTYAFRGNFQTTANVAGGIQFSVSGTATATAISYEGTLQAAAAVVAQTRATALDTVVCASTTTTAGTCHIEGVIQVNAAGTITINFAQNVSNGSASTVLANQYFALTPIN